MLLPSSMAPEGSSNVTVGMLLVLCPRGRAPSLPLGVRCCLFVGGRRLQAPSTHTHEKHISDSRKMRAAAACLLGVLAAVPAARGFAQPNLVIPSRGHATGSAAVGGRGVGVRGRWVAPRSGRAPCGAHVRMAAAPSPVVGGLAAFLEASPTPYHMVAAASEQLRSEGFVELKEGERWAEEGVLAKGGKYFYNREGSTLVAFTVGGEFEPGGRRVVPGCCYTYAHIHMHAYMCTHIYREWLQGRRGAYGFARAKGQARVRDQEFGLFAAGR